MAFPNATPPGVARLARSGKEAVGSRFKRLRGDRRASVAAIMGLSMIPMIAAVGVGIDLVRVASAKAKLQSAADAAALAGAILYTDVSRQQIAQDSAAAAMARYSQTGDFAVGATTATAVPGGVTVGSYQVTVTTTATVPTTLLQVAYGSTQVPMTVSATASLPWNTPHFPPSPNGGAIGTPSQAAGDGSRQKIDAGDWNAAFAYAVPMVNGVPDYNRYPPFSEFTEIASNCTALVDTSHQAGAQCDGKPGALPPVTPSFAPLPDQPIAFMFLNMLGGQAAPGNNSYPYDAAGYQNDGSTHYHNSYGLRPGQYAVLLTAQIALGNSPAGKADDSVNFLNSLVGGGFNVPARQATSYTSSIKTDPITGKALKNCALQIRLVTDPNNVPADPVKHGACYSLDDANTGIPQYANLSCNQLAGRTLVYFWNDMGWLPDDYDYKNLMYMMNCDSSSTNPGSGGTTPSALKAPVKLTQ